MAKRLLTWLAGAAGSLAAYRVLTRRRGSTGPPAVDPDTRAEELREKLAHARETVAAEPADAADDVDARRRSVHEHGRAAIDEMHAE